MQDRAIGGSPDEPLRPDDGDCLGPVEWNDDQWDVFLPDDDQHDPQPEPGDFWAEPDQSA